MSSYKYKCFDCGKTYIGPRLENNMLCNCNPPKKIKGTLIVTPLSDELLEVLSTHKAEELRISLCAKWNIINKSHVQHGSNFSSNQTVANLINNIVQPVKGGLRLTVRLAVIKDYGYDIDSQSMV